MSTPLDPANALPLASYGLRKRATQHSAEMTVETRTVEVDPVPAVTPEPACTGSSRIYNLWLASRQQANGEEAILETGTQRVLNVRNAVLALQLLPLIWWRWACLFSNLHRMRVVLHVVGRIVNAVLPTLELWATAKFLDEVQARVSQPSLSYTGADSRNQLYAAAALSMFAKLAEWLNDLMTDRNREVVEQEFTHAVETKYMGFQLSLDIPTLSNRSVRDLLNEAGCFAGFERMGKPGEPGRRSYGPRSSIYAVLNLATVTIQGLSTTWLMWTRLPSNNTNSSSKSSDMLSRMVGSLASAASSPGGLIFSLSLLPQLLRFSGPYVVKLLEKFLSDETKPSATERGIATILRFLRPTDYRSFETKEYRLRANGLRNVRDLVSTPTYKQEVVLFDLKNWVLNKWESLRREEMASRLDETTNFTSEVGGKTTPPSESQNALDYENVRLHNGMKIEARNLGFSYPSAEKCTLRDINLTIEAGSTVAVVGMNGGGKTTLVKVLLGLFDHTGELLINDHTFDHLNPRQVHARSACCFQDFCRYAFELRENVAVGDITRATDKEAINTAITRGGAEGIKEKVGLDSVLDRSAVPDTVATTRKDGRDRERGAALSGGEWQRLALARAFMRAEEADLVVFDEPSAALDARAEAELFKRIHNLASTRNGGGKPTTIFTSHRFATVKRADQIIVVEDGTILEKGNHDSLMALKGRYAEFYTLQRDGFD